MVNYADGKIYKIECKTTGKVYIGSTCAPSIEKRLIGHIAQYKQYLEGKSKSYCSSYEVLKDKNYEIILVASYACENKIQLYQKEKFHIIENKQFCVNKYNPGKMTESESKNAQAKRDKVKNDYYEKIRGSNHHIKVPETETEYRCGKKLKSLENDVAELVKQTNITKLKLNLLKERLRAIKSLNPRLEK